MTRTVLMAAAALLALYAAAPADETKSSSEGFVQLFNGKDLTGWKTHPDDPKDTKWEVVDGAITASGPKAAHLFSERDDYTDFVFRMEVKLSDGSNSGQYFRTKFMKGFPNGYEAQLNATHGDKIKTGSLYPFMKDGGKRKEYTEKFCVLNTAPHKPNEWFTQEVTAVGNHITIKVNGKQTVDYVDDAKTFTKGHFAIQYHDPKSKVWVRKVEVKELGAK